MTTITDTDTTDALALEAQKRSAYTAGLRALADLLDGQPTVPLPNAGSGQYTPLSFAVGYDGRDDDETTKARVVAIARALIAGQWIKKYDKPDAQFYGDGCLRIYGKTAGGLTVQIYTPREKVCRKVVTSTEVTKTVPDPTIEVPQVEVTETVETVEWVCEPILAATS